MNRLALGFDGGKGWDVRYQPGLNTQTPLRDRLEAALAGATRLEIAVAYAKVSGSGPLLRLPTPQGSRAVVGLGFGLSDPPAVEQLASAGVSLRLVTDTAQGAAERYHPKLYLTTRPQELVVHSGSANLTGGGLTSNVEQYEELIFEDPSTEADHQRARFEELWDRYSVGDSSPLGGLGRVPPTSSGPPAPRD